MSHAPPPRIAIVIPARNEAGRLAKTLDSIEQQTLKPHRIIVVNDGSTDNTLDDAQDRGTVEVITRPPHESYLISPKLAETINCGLEKLDNDHYDYVMMSGADTIYPPDYLEQITTRMDARPQLVIATGTIAGEAQTSSPRGTARLIKYDFWSRLGLRYPVNYGFESYLVLKAWSLGYETENYSDIVITVQRKTGTRISSRGYYTHGLAYKAIGYPTTYTLVRALLMMRRSPMRGVHLIRGYFSNYTDLYEPELRAYVKTHVRTIPRIRRRIR